MNVEVPKIVRVEDLPPGTLFYHLNAGQGVLCISGDSTQERGADQRQVIPLQYDASPGSVGVGIYQSHFPGWALILEDAVARVDETSAATDGVDARIFVSDAGLYCPVLGGRGFRAGFIDLASGKISPHVSNLIGFTRWEIVRAGDPDSVIWSSEGQANDEKNQG